MQRDESHQKQQETPLCVKGCGFFGRESTGGMCSKCYKESQVAVAPKPAVAAVASVAPVASVAAPAPTTTPPVPALTLSTAPAAADSTMMEVVPDPAPALAASSAAPSTPSASPALGPVDAASVVAAAAGAGAAATGASGSGAAPLTPTRTQADRSRCMKCRKKVGLNGIECRCGFVYCGQHRYAEEHDCTFDFKTFGRASIAAANERVVAHSLEDKL